MFFNFSLLFPVLFPPLCFPIAVPVVLPRCNTPLLGRSPRANRWKTDDLGLVPIFNKIFQKSVIFIFSPSIYVQTLILKQLNKIKKYVFFVFFTFHFSLLFPVLFPPLCHPIVVPLFYPVALPRCWVEVLEPTVAKTDDLGLVPIFK